MRSPRSVGSLLPITNPDLSLPGGDFGLEALLAVDAPIQALTAQHANLDLDHVQPAGVLGDIVELQAVQQAPASAGGKA